jgi:hypothetical protein
MRSNFLLESKNASDWFWPIGKKVPEKLVIEAVWFHSIRDEKVRELRYCVRLYTVRKYLRKFVINKYGAERLLKRTNFFVTYSMTTSARSYK